MKSLSKLLLAACMSAGVTTAMVHADDAKPTPLRPATVAWGGYNHNEQVIGSDGQWDYVARHMDGYLLHGAYWATVKADDPTYLATLQALGAILRKHGKPAHYETGFGEPAFWDPNVPTKRGGYSRAQQDISRMKQWAEAGVVVDKIRVDWFPMPAMSAYAKRYQTTDMRQLLARATGASELFGKVEGFDPAMGNWREYVTLVNQAFPGIKLCFDQAPCNHGPVNDPVMRAAMPWPGFGYGYVRPMKLSNHEAVLVDGKPATLVFDFMDQLMGVKVASAEAKVNYVGFEGDTPFNYFTDSLPNFPGDALTKYLLAIERHMHSQGLRSGRFLNDSGKHTYGDGWHAWLRVNFKTAQSIGRIRIVWGNVQALDGLIEVSSDGNNWQFVSRLRDQKIVNNIVDLKLDKPVNALAVRFNGRRASVNAPYEMAELEVFSQENPTTNLALRAKVQASSEAESHAAALAVDGNAQTCWSNQFLPADQWDKTFHDRSIEFLEYWQSVGGRADDYIVESWYDGPFTNFPETKPGTFTSLTRYVLRRLRGIDDQDQVMKVSLAARASDAGAFRDEDKLQLTGKPGTMIPVEIRVQNDARDRNPGDARATPLLRAVISSGRGKLVCKNAEGKDVTDQLLAQGLHDGLFVGGINAGQSTVIRLELSPESDVPMNVSLDLYWNPQQTDPKPRDQMMITAVSR